MTEKMYFRSVIKDCDLESKDDARKQMHHLDFSLATEDDNSLEMLNSTCNNCKLFVNSVYDDAYFGNQAKTVSSAVPLPALSLNPHRAPEILTSEIFDLICSQMKYIVGLQHKQLVQSTMHAMVEACLVKLSGGINVQEDFYDILWSSAFLGEDDGVNGSAAESDFHGEKRRGRSPGRGMRGSSLEARKSAHSLSKLRVLNQSGNNSDGGDGGSLDLQRSNERRSRSASTGKRPSVTGVVGSSKQSVTFSTLDVDATEEQICCDPFILRQIEILKSLPPDLHHRVTVSKGPVHGVWMIQSPLMIHPITLEESLHVVSESSLTDIKKLEWQLDLMREYDERRIDKFERFLAIKRNHLYDQALSLTRKTQGIGSKNGSVARVHLRGTVFNGLDYYKDRGRQPYRQIDSKAP